MAFVDTLLNSSASDLDLLQKNLARGDRLEVSRDVDFLLNADTEKKAELMCSFVTDNHYGRPSYQKVQLENDKTLWRVVIVINTPASENIICSLNGHPSNA